MDDPEGEKRGKFFKKNEAIASRGWKHGFFENQDQRNETKKKKGLVGKLDVSEIAQRSPSRAIESSRVESSSSNGPFFLFCFTTLLDAYVSLFFLFFLLLIRMSCDLLYLRGGGRGWNSDAVAGIKRLHFFE